jgi:hypothetical protein
MVTKKKSINFHNFPIFIKTNFKLPSTKIQKHNQITKQGNI